MFQCKVGTYIFYKIFLIFGYVKIKKMIQNNLRIKILIERTFLFQVSFFFHIMSVRHTIEELKQLRAEARKALHDPELIDKKDDLNQSIDEIQQEIDSLKFEIVVNIFTIKFPDLSIENADQGVRTLLIGLYLDESIENADQGVRTRLKELDNQLESKTADYAILLDHKKALRSTIGLYSTQIEHRKKKGRQKEKKERTSRKKEQKSKKKKICHQSKSKHPLAHNYYFALLSYCR